MVKDTEVRKDEHSEESYEYSYEGCNYGGSTCCPYMYQCPYYLQMTQYTSVKVGRDEDEEGDDMRSPRRHMYHPYYPYYPYHPYYPYYHHHHPYYHHHYMHRPKMY